MTAVEAVEWSSKSETEAAAAAKVAAAAAVSAAAAAARQQQQQQSDHLPTLLRPFWLSFGYYGVIDTCSATCLLCPAAVASCSLN